MRGPRTYASDADLVREAILATKLTQEQFASQLGVGLRSVTGWLAGAPIWAPVRTLCEIIVDNPTVLENDSPCDSSPSPV